MVPSKLETFSLGIAPDWEAVAAGADAPFPLAAWCNSAELVVGQPRRACLKANSADVEVGRQPSVMTRGPGQSLTSCQRRS